MLSKNSTKLQQESHLHLADLLLNDSALLFSVSPSWVVWGAGVLFVRQMLFSQILQ